MTVLSDETKKSELTFSWYSTSLPVYEKCVVWYRSTNICEKYAAPSSLNICI